MLTPSHRLEGEPCGMRQPFEAAVSWSYDSPAKGGLHHAHYPGRVANRMDLLKWTSRAAAPVFAIMLCGSNSARAAASQSQISGCVSPLPAPILALADVAFPVRSFLCHARTSFVLVAQTTTTEVAQSLLIFSEDRNIFIRFCTHRKSLFFVYCGAVFALRC